jgi:SseB protein N-terminal domain
VVESEGSEPALYKDLTDFVRIARRGLRSDVAKLVEQLEDGALLVPLAKVIDDVPVGEALVAADGEVRLAPHLLPDREGAYFVPLFTDADVLRTVGQYLEWSTDGDDDLQYCTLPARAALDIALQLIDDTTIRGLVINPSDEHELILRRYEVGALAQGQAIPLVGYVNEIPMRADENRLVSELDKAPAPELIAAIESCLSGLPGVRGYRLQQTFNAERDVEPHPTLFLELPDPDAVDLDDLNRRLAETLDGKLPEPGYIDVLFDTGNEADSRNESAE